MKKLLFILLFCTKFCFSQNFISGNKIEIDANGKVTIDSTVTFGTSTSTNVSIDATNAIKLNGGSTVWDDLFFPFTTGHQGNAGYPPLNVDSLYYSFAVDSVGNDAQYMIYAIQLPHRWLEGSGILEPHVHYKYESAVGTPTFTMKYKWYDIGETTQVGWSWYTMGTTTGTDDKTHQIVDGTGGISCSGHTFSSILICYVYLSAVSGTGSCNAWQFDIHYLIDSMGSKDEYAK